MKILTAIKKCFILVIIRLNQNTMMTQTNQVIGKMKDETGSVAIEESVGLKPKMYLFLVDDNSEHKKANKRCEYKCRCNNKS